MSQFLNGERSSLTPESKTKKNNPIVSLSSIFQETSWIQVMKQYLERGNKDLACGKEPNESLSYFIVSRPDWQYLPGCFQPTYAEIASQPNAVSNKREREKERERLLD